MTILTRGLGQTNTILTAGLGVYTVLLVPEADYGGSGFVRKEKFEVMPKRIFLTTKVGEPSLRLKDIEPQQIAEVLEKATEVTVEGEKYFVTGGPEPTPTAALKMLPQHELEAKLKAVMKEMVVTRALARKALKARAAKEIEAAKIFKMALVKEDEELALIIIMSEV